MEEQQKLSKWTTAFGLSYSLISLFSALLVVLKEKSKTLVDILGIEWNIWSVHSCLAIALFVALGFWFMFTKRRSDFYASAESLTYLVTGSTVLSGLIIGGFYLF